MYTGALEDTVKVVGNKEELRMFFIDSYQKMGTSVSHRT